MTTQKISNLDCVLIGDTYYTDLSAGGSYLLPVLTMNKTAGKIYVQTWEKLKPEQQKEILNILKNYGREVVSKRKTRIVDGFSGGYETVSIEPASKKYIIWMMDLVKDLSGVLSSYTRYIEFEY